MFKPTKHLIFALTLATTAGFAQQSPQPQTPQQTETQATPAPCTPAASSTGAANTGSIITPTEKTQQTIAKARKKWSDKLGFDIPDPTQLAKPKKSLPPCQPVKAEAQPAPVAKAPSDASVTLRCNPLVAPAKGATGASPGFTLPDPHQYGTPGQANPFEADSAVPDLNAKTPCYALKVDPKTNKYFIAQ